MGHPIGSIRWETALGAVSACRFFLTLCDAPALLTRQSLYRSRHELFQRNDTDIYAVFTSLRTCSMSCSSTCLSSFVSLACGALFRSGYFLFSCLLLCLPLTALQRSCEIVSVILCARRYALDCRCPPNSNVYPKFQAPANPTKGSPLPRLTSNVSSVLLRPALTRKLRMKSSTTSGRRVTPAGGGPPSDAPFTLPTQTGEHIVSLGRSESGIRGSFVC
jgi:hypothetical protein